MSNRQRMDAIVALATARAVPTTPLGALRQPLFQPGDRVRWNGEEGVIDVAYFDLQAAIDAFAVPKDWYQQLERRPKTPPNGRWYAVILTKGAVLGGELDIEPWDSP